MSQTLSTTFTTIDNCLNCEYELEPSANYCLDCGAKIKESRFTIKRILAEFSEHFFSLDNTFTKTFIDLWIKPDAVVNGFVSGLRKRYMNPISYFTIALTISGLQTFVIKRFYPNALTDMYGQEQTGFIATAIVDYQTIMVSATIPLLAFIGWIVFYTLKKYNYAEHLILNFYVYSQYAIVATLGGTFCLIAGWNYAIFAYIIIFLTFVYYSYVYMKIFGLSTKGFVLRVSLFTVVSGLFLVLSSILAAVIMILTDTMPQKV